MKSPKYIIFVILALIFTFAAGSVFAQRSDRDNPIPLSSGDISGSFIDHQKDNNKELFYSFTAGPGELTITFDVKNRSRGDMASMAFELLPSNGSSTALLCCEGAQAGEGGTGREVANVRLTRRQTVILHITNASVGGGTFQVRLSGASVSFGGSSGGGNEGRGDNDGDDNGRGRGRGNRGETVSVPSSGILHIRMKNGTVQDIDLSRIREITVR